MSETTGLLYNPKSHHRKSHWTQFFKLAIVSSLLLLIWIELGNMAHKDVNGDISLKLYSHNIRYDNNNVQFKERPWSERKHEVFKSIKFNTFGSSSTVITLQEVLKNQLDDLLGLLNEGGDKGWVYFGVGRNDGKEAGEYAPILFNTNDFELIDSSTFWLSETPDVPSIGWDADQVRIVTWARLQKGKKSINVFNTHLDHLGVKAREESVKLIANKTRTYNDDISFITGDFNSEPSEEAYQTLSGVFKDSRLHSRNTYGFTDTFTGFENGERHKVIDYVFFDPRLEEVEGFGVLDNNFKIYSSDHRPVIVEVNL